MIDLADRCNISLGSWRSLDFVAMHVGNLLGFGLSDLGHGHLVEVFLYLLFRDVCVHAGIDPFLPHLVLQLTYVGLGQAQVSAIKKTLSYFVYVQSSKLYGVYTVTFKSYTVCDVTHLQERSSSG